MSRIYAALLNCKSVVNNCHSNNIILVKLCSKVALLYKIGARQAWDMASIPCPPSTATNTTPSTLSFCHHFEKNFRISTSRNQKHNHCCFKVSCKAKDCDQNPTKNGETSLALGKFDRRDVLIGLGCLYGGTATLASVDPVAFATPAEVFPIKLDKAMTVTVPRPKKKRSKKEKDEEEEILVIEGIEVDRDAFVKFNVFVNEEDEVASGPDKTEFAGSFVNVPRRRNGKKQMKTTRLILGISDLLEDLEAEDDYTVLVTLVPKIGCDSVTIGAVKIEFDS